MEISIINAWTKFLKNHSWDNLIQSIQPTSCGCGLVYSLPNILQRPSESFAIADMRNLVISEPHYHPEIEYYFIIKGTGLMVLGYNEFPVKVGDVITIPSNIAHFIVPDNNLVLAVVNTPPFNEAQYTVLSESNEKVQFDQKQFKTLFERAVIERTAHFIKNKFINETTGHDWWHIYRVWQLAKKIALQEKETNIFIIELGALLHDIADWKFNNGDENAGPKAAEEWLLHCKVPHNIINEVTKIIKNISFKGANSINKIHSIEGKIIQDADRLDALGAIGISRVFAFSGAKGNPIHNPEKKPRLALSEEQYKKIDGTAINHFYEKLFLLKDLMNTSEGRSLALQRHIFMEKFLEEFYKEWEVN